jgi:hypothetical protein
VHSTTTFFLDAGLQSKHTGLAQQNDFGTAFLHMMMRLTKGTTKPNTCSLVVVVVWVDGLIGPVGCY